MTKITLQQAQEIVDRLSDKTLSFGCMIDWGKLGSKIRGRTTNVRPYTWFDHSDDEECLSPEQMKHGCYDKILGHPVRIGDVLAKMKESGTSWSHDIRLPDGRLKLAVDLLLTSWEKLGFTRSLQDILAVSETEGTLTGPAAELFSFLQELSL